MAKQKKQHYDGIVYSTSNDFDYNRPDDDQVLETLPNNKQHLKVSLDKKQRKGKVVTLITGFVGSDSDLEDLAKKLKQKCGVGGAAKDSEILIQGDFKEKIINYLISENYNVKPIGG